MNKKYKVEIREYETGHIVKVSPAHRLRRAEKLEDAYNINLDHTRYYTLIKEVM